MDETPIETMQKYVDGIQWPASKEEVLQAVERNGAPGDVLEALRAEDRERFVGPNAVHEALWKQA